MTALDQVVDGRRVVICAGPGGVGKTTCAAAIALEAARRGKRACVVTIDPAKRLADALGLESLTNDARQVDLGPSGSGTGPGELWALMLDTKTTFDEVVRRNAGSAEQAQAILDNKLYRNISGALGGTQEYMAMEKLYSLDSEGHYDLIVVDTPPTRHALDFLDAPKRLLRFLNNRIFRLLMAPTRASLRALGTATQMFLRTLSKVVGGAVVGDAVAFFTAFEGMEQGFRDRAALVSKLLEDPATAFVVVAAPRRDAVVEAVYFADRLRSSTGRVEALVANRMFPSFGGVPAGLAGAASATSSEGSAEGDGSAVAVLAQNLADFEGVSSREEAHLSELSERLPGTPVVRVPFLSTDVHDIEGLREIGGYLFGGEGGDGRGGER
ncbi:MAG TPA: ArsA-related P-loop ATPase [Acidimicrobiales bacterium]|nr:ArsA-related P-loop ATPase [Acidimicrobiales bacterium]